MIERRPYRQEWDATSRKFIRYAGAALLFCLVGFNWLATQRAAAALHYPPFLTGRLMAHVYRPFAWWWWQSRWPHGGVQIGNRIILLQPIWLACEHEVIYPMLALGLLFGLCSAALTRRRGPADLHGSASWADVSEIRRARLL